MTRRLGAVLAGLLLGVLAVLIAPASPASAHAALLRSDPPANSVVGALPAEVVLTFSETVELVPGRARVIGPDGNRVDRDGATVRGAELHIPLRSGGARGTYVVSYRLISADSHPVGGAITFAVGAPSATPPAAGADTSARTDRLVAILLAAARYLGYAGLVLVAGPTIFLALLWPRRLPRRGPVRLVFAGLGLLLAGTVAELYLQAPYSAGTSLFGADQADARAVFNSRYGAAHLVRLAVVAASAVLLRPFLLGAPAPGDGVAQRNGVPPKGGAARQGVADRAMLAILAVVGLATWPMAGHAGASSLPAVTAVADVAHLGAMSLWLGGLVALVAFVLRQANAKELGAILPVWSRWATTAVGVLVVAGTLQALIEIGTPKALVATTYGRLVMVKVALLAIVLVVAWFARRRARAPESASEARRVRRLVVVELAVTAVVLGLSATLVQTTPARSAQAVAAQRNAGPFSVTLTSKLYSVRVEVDPAKVGGNAVHLYVYTPDGAPLDVLEWGVTMALPVAGIEPIQVTMLRITDNHATGEAQLFVAGDWELRVNLRVSRFDEAPVTTKVPIT